VSTKSSFDYAIVRVVPRVERGEFLNAGAILYSSTLGYLGARVALDRARLLAFAPGVDVDDVERALALIPLVCSGAPGSGSVGALPQTERFHWLTAPRSTVVQTSAVHSGLCTEPEKMLESLLRTMVLPPV